MKIKHIIGWICLLVLAGACTKDNFVNSGVSNGRHEGKNIIEYMEEHPYDWSLTLELIRHAGQDIVTLFEGKDPEYKEITFFGITNNSIRRYLFENEIESVTDISSDWCREILLQHVVNGKMWRKDFPVGEPDEFNMMEPGGIMLTTLAGTKLWVCIVVREQEGIIQNVAKPIYLRFMKSSRNFGVASGDIEPDNGVIHALEYNFTLGDEE